MFSCLQILEAFLWFVLITLLNVTLIILTLSVSRLLNLLLRLVAFLLFLNPQCLASISRWITASSSWKRFCLFVCRALSFFFSSSRRHTIFDCDWSSDVCSSDLERFARSLQDQIVPHSTAEFCPSAHASFVPHLSYTKRLLDHPRASRLHFQRAAMT